jgi:hypothetical protein
MNRGCHIIVGMLACFMALQAMATMRDPTQPPGMEYASRVQQNAIDLQGIYYRKGHSSVVIDGQHKLLGDSVGDAKITQISADHVVLTGDDGSVVLRMSYPVIRQPVGEKGKNGSH